MNEWPSRLAIAIDMAKTRGRVSGLTDAEADEVVQAWVKWSQVRFDPVPWDRVGTSMTLRAMGKEWRP